MPLTFVSNLDFAQTFLDIAGVDKIPEAMQGRSLKPIFQGKTPADWRNSVYYHYYEYPGGHSVRRHYGVRTDGHKLIHYYNLDAWELFDLQEDPNELKSVYDDPKNSTTIAEMKTELARLRTLYMVPEDTRPVKQAVRKPKPKGAKTPKAPK